MRLFVVGLLTCCSLQGWAQSSEIIPPKIVPVGLHTVYIPEGFDSNDRVQVTVEGVFSDSCFKVGSHSVTKKGKSIFIQQKALRYSGACLEILTPFPQTVDLGILAAGKYEIFDSFDRSKMGELNVAEAKSSDQDEYLYAPVSDAILSSASGRTDMLVLSGIFPLDCLTVDDVKVNVKNHVVIVQPIMAKQTQCHDGIYPYEKRVSFDPPPRGRYLLHVRSLNGQAINKLVDIY